MGLWHSGEEQPLLIRSTSCHLRIFAAVCMTLRSCSGKTFNLNFFVVVVWLKLEAKVSSWRGQRWGLGSHAQMCERISKCIRPVSHLCLGVRVNGRSERISLGVRSVCECVCEAFELWEDKQRGCQKPPPSSPKIFSLTIQFNLRLKRRAKHLQAASPHQNHFSHHKSLGWIFSSRTRYSPSACWVSYPISCPLYPESSLFGLIKPNTALALSWLFVSLCHNGLLKMCFFCICNVC